MRDNANIELGWPAVTFLFAIVVFGVVLIGHEPKWPIYVSVLVWWGCIVGIALSHEYRRPCQTRRHLTKHTIVNLVGEIHRFINRVRSGYDAMIYLPLPGEPYAGNEAGTQIDHPSINSISRPGPLVALGQHYAILLRTNIDVPDRVTIARPPPIERETALQKAIPLQSPNVELAIFASDALRSVTSTAAISTHASLLDSPKSLGKLACFQIAVATSPIPESMIYAFYSPTNRLLSYACSHVRPRRPPPRINRGMIYLGACLIAVIRLTSLLFY